MINYYVSVINGPKRALLLGPYPTHEQALALVDKGRELACQVDPFAHFYAFGTASIDTANHFQGRLPVGKLNHLLEAKNDNPSNI